MGRWEKSQLEQAKSDGYNGRNELLRELRPLNPWPKDLRFEDAVVEPSSVVKLCRPESVHRSICGSSMLPLGPDQDG